MTSNLALWPRMSMIVINRDVLDSLSSRQHGILEGAVVRSQDLAMAAPDIPAVVKDACKAGAKFGSVTADQLAALTEAVQPVYTKLSDNPAEAKLLKAIQDAVKVNAGTGALTVAKSCKYVPPTS